MKLVAVITFVLGTGLSFSQEWRDSLEVARKAYGNDDYERALKYYKSAQKNAPDDIDLSDEIGQSAYKSGDFETAEKVFEQNAGNKSTSTERANNYHNIGNSRMKKGDINGAAEAYREALRLNPKDKRARYNLSKAQRKINEEKRKNNSSRSPENNPGDPNNPQNGGRSPRQENGSPGDGDKDGQNQGDNNGDNQGQNSESAKTTRRRRGEDGSGANRSGNKSQLPNKTVEKMLDEIMTNEAATKRRMAGNGGGGFAPRSGKDW